MRSVFPANIPNIGNQSGCIDITNFKTLIEDVRVNRNPGADEFNSIPSVMARYVGVKKAFEEVSKKMRNRSGR